MWWIISLIDLILLVIEAIVTTFFLVIMLNGFPSLPDALVNSYFVCTGGSLVVLSLLDGFMAKKLSEISPMRLWLAGILTTIVTLSMMPITLFVLITVHSLKIE